MARASSEKANSAHPATRFEAGSTIRRGTPLKELMGSRSIQLLAESIKAVMPGFDSAGFRRRATRGLDRLELMQRGLHIAEALADQLPRDVDAAAELLIASLGPELTATKGNGLAVFFYLPHSQWIATRGAERVESGLRANYELTKRFTAEFSIRPFLEKHLDETLRRLDVWAGDPNAHVRRLVSEGTRPRLPWAMRLRAIREDPRLTLPLLEKLKDDPEEYVRRSVANHLGDVLKDHPDLAYDVCRRWLDEITRLDPPDPRAASRRRLIRHALRLPARKGDPRAVLLLKSAGGVPRRTRATS